MLEDSTQLLQLKDISLTYKSSGMRDIPALKDVSIDVAASEFITIVGPSGCGKSTLLKIVAGLLPVSKGLVRFGDRVVTQPHADVGIMFQDPCLLPWRTALGNILLPTELLKLNRQDSVNAAHDLLDLVGLRGFEDHLPYQLSGGMQQRVAICRALINDPAVLLMDEPFGALDAMTREDMMMELLRIWSDSKKTVLFVTHSITEAVFLADRVVVMSSRPGRVSAVIDVDLPRPRDRSLETSEQFGVIKDRIRSVIAESSVPRLSVSSYSKEKE